MGNNFGKNLSALPKVQESPTSVGCFHEICYKLFEHFGHNLQKGEFSYLHENVLYKRMQHLHTS